jgi:hypothetical protein
MQRTLALIWAIMMVCISGAATWVVALTALAATPPLEQRGDN